jgi:hypothetical protein
MNLPGFHADLSLYTSDVSFASGPFVVARGDAIIPAIPACKNCDWILDKCSKNGWLPRAVCNACYFGNCYSGVEVPPSQLQFP